MSDITFNLQENKMEVHNERAEPWNVTLVDTGENTMTGGRLKRLKDYLKDEESFCFTYGDGVSNINIKELISFHNRSKKIATITTVLPVGRFGAVVTKDNIVTEFIEKPRGDGGRVNGGFFVLSPKVLDYIEGDQTSWEEAPMEKLSKEGNMIAFEHEDFWQSMDTVRDKMYLEELWDSGKAPWKVWK
jgi:glucose-1-phosphate cytidylyltransferase